MWIYFLGCISLGAVAGFLVGISSSPVVGVVLPLLFALLGGATGILGLLPGHPNSERSKVRFRIVGGAAAAVSIPFLLTVNYGILLRTGNNLGSLIVQSENQYLVSQTDIDNLHVEEILDVYLLDAMLARLGVQKTQKQKILRRYLDIRVTAVQSYVRRRPKLLQAAQDFRSSKATIVTLPQSAQYDAAETYIEVAAGQKGAPSRQELRVFRNLYAVMTVDTATEDVESDESAAQLVRIVQQVPLEDLSSPLGSSASNTAQSSATDQRFGTYPALIEQFWRSKHNLAINPPPMLSPDDPDTDNKTNTDALTFG